VLLHQAAVLVAHRGESRVREVLEGVGVLGVAQDLATELGDRVRELLLRGEEGEERYREESR
jgi:hypothetical protein